MSETRQPDGPRRNETLTLGGLARLLDTYGAAAEHWPQGEREAARRLVEESAAARTLWQEAAELDRLLDTVQSAPPSQLLAAQVLAAAPRRRPTRVWRAALAAAVPLAAAAGLVLWFTLDRQPQRPPAEVDLASVGEYASPTDVLLQPFAVDVSGTLPSVGCTDSVLGCPDVDAAGETYSHRQSVRRSLA